MKNKSANWIHFAVNCQLFAVWFLGIAVLVCSSGCGTTTTDRPPDYDARAAAKTKAVGQPDAANSEESDPLVLAEGDSIKISFPGAPSLDTLQTIRRDGKITLSDGNEMDAAGKTPSQLEKDLIDHYASQLVSKQVTVTVQHSSFSIYVQGAVLKPGKVNVDHPMTVLEAINEAGGFDFSKANLKAVKVIREKPAESYTFNFNGLLKGEQTHSLYLKPNDLVYVPEKFIWF